MNRTVGFLADFCAKHLLDEKLFVVPSYSIGSQIGQHLARETGSWVNLRFVTFSALALRIAAADLEAGGKSELTDTEIISRVDGLFRELKDSNRLRYFHRLEPVPGVIKALHGALQSLRSAGIGAAELEKTAFRVAAKGRDLALFLRRYEERLEKENVLDRPGVLRFAIDRAGRKAAAGADPAWVLCLRDRKVGPLEKELVRAFAGERLVLVPGDPVFGLDRPDSVWEEDTSSRGPRPSPSSDSGRLPWLFDPRGAPEPFRDGTLELFRALGPTNECREVLRRILAERSLFDDVEIIHPPGGVHTSVFHLLAEKEAIPVTFAEGVPISFTSAGRVFAGLADWIENGFLVRHLCDLIRAGDFAFPWTGGGEPPSPDAVCRHLTGAGIVKGKARYLDRLGALRRSYESSLDRETPGEEGETTVSGTEGGRRAVSEIARLERAVNELLDSFSGIDPDDDGGLENLVPLCEGFVRVLRTSVSTRTERDELALEAISSRIRQAAGDAGRPGPPSGLSVADALERLRSFVSPLSVGASPPLPGHLHVSSVGSGGFSGRPVTYLVGLGETGISGRGLEDPILLDEERRALSPDLPSSADRLRQDLFALAALLSSLCGRVVLSYPSYDILEERAAFPSSLILQAHRLVRGNPDLDYTDLDRDLRPAAGFLPGEASAALDETDWWLARLERDGRFFDGLAAVRKNFPELGSGLAAAAARNGQALSAYEGIIRIDPSRHDPLSNHGIVLSASRLELLAKCPYAYFLRYVLKIAPPEVLEFDPARWLDPRQRGSLIHEILHDFMLAVRTRRETVEPDRHRDLIRETADRVIGSWKDSIPPPSEAIFAKERKDVIETLEVFLVAESRRREKVEPLDFEKRFSGVEIPIGAERSFLLRGVIDRIDRLGPGAYRIVDYKTGSPSPYEGLVAFGRGRIIQHALYAVAAEDILAGEGTDPGPRVTKSGYYFPTRRGEGREIMVEDFDRETFRRLLADMLDLVVRGYFIAGLPSECGYCDYSPVCGGEAKAAQDKLEANPEIFEAYARLKRYE